MKSLALLLVLCSAACSVSMDPLPGAGGGTAGSGGSGTGAGGMGIAGSGAPPRDGAAETAAVVAGKVVDLRTRLPVPMARLSVDMHPEITPVTTAADGSFTLASVPTGIAVTVRLEKDAYFPAQIPLVADGSRIDLAPVRLVPTDAPDALAGAAGAPADASLGHVLVLALSDTMGTGLDGVAVTMTPSPSAGPAYLDPNNERDTGLRTTGTAGAALFTNVAPGEVEVRVTHPSRQCRPLHAPPGAGPGSVKVTVTAGRVTAGVEVLCPP